MTTLLLWRHGTTTWNADHRVQGHQDAPLAETGRDQATRTAPHLAARRPVVVTASDLSRAADTAAPLAELTGLPVTTDPRLRERCYGQWEGLTMAEIAERFPEAHARQRAGEHELGYGIEPPRDVMKRVGEVLDETADRAAAHGADATAVVVTHGGAARYGVFALLGWPTEQLGSVAVLANCHFTELRRDPVRGWTLVAHNVGPAEGLPGYE